MSTTNATKNLTKSGSIRIIYGIAIALVCISYAVYFKALYLKPIDSPSSSVKLVNFSQLNVPLLDFGSNESPLNLNQHTYIYEDKTNQLTIHDIRKLDNAVFSKPTLASKINLGIRQANIWLVHRSRIIATNSYPTKLYIELTQSRLNHLEFFLLRDNGELYKIGGNKQHKKNHLGHFNEVIPLPKISEEDITIFIKLTTSNYMTFDLLLWDQQSFTSKVTVENFIFGFFYGSLGLMAVYNFFIFLRTQDNSYLFFVLYSVFITMFQLTLQGHGPLLGQWGKQIFQPLTLPYYLWASCAAITMFVRVFLQTQKKHRAMDFCLKASLFIIAFQVITSLFIDDYTTYEWITYSASATFIFIFIVITSCFLLKNINAKFLLIGWVINMTGSIILAFIYLGILPANSFLFQSPLITLSLGGVFLSFALSDRIKRNEKQASDAKLKAINTLSRYETTFNNAVEGIYTMNLSGDFINVNPTFIHMLGYRTAEELIKDSRVASRRIYKDPDAFYAQLAEHHHHQEEIIISNESSTLWAIHSAKLSFTKEGKPSYIEGTLVNISDDKLKAIAQTKKARAQIEKEEALNAAKSKSQFLANMSHELRTPLTAIIGYSEALIDEYDDNHKRQYLKIISRSGNHLIELINDVIDLSKVESNELEITPRETDIYQLLDEIYGYFETRIKDKGLFFKIKYQWPLPQSIVTDSTRTKQILLNLCSNALKFTTKGGITITVNWLKEKNQLSISVIDTGIGLTEDQQGKLFKSYSQADASTARNFGGTGLGLVISKQFAEKMGGDITVDSTPNVGTTFTLMLGMPSETPPELVHGKNQLTHRQTDEQQQDRLPEHISGNILAVDSDPNGLTIISQFLQGESVTIKGADSYSKAKQLLANNAFELILINQDMFVNNEPIANLTQHSQHKKLIIYTANVIANQVDFNPDQSHSAMSILEKPFSRTDLFNAITTALSDSTRGNGIKSD